VHSAVRSLVDMGMYLRVLINFFHFALKRYFISKTVTCFWCILYVREPEVYPSNTKPSTLDIILLSPI